MSFCFLFLQIIGIDTYAQNSLLWEISGGNTLAPSYLFGTIHIADQRVFKFSDSLCQAFRNCTVLAGELNVRDIDKKGLAKEIMMPSGITLSHFVGDSGVAKVKAQIRTIHPMMALLVNKIRPFYTMALLAQAGFKSDRKETLDEYLQKLARKNKMRVVGLETMQEQIAAVNTIPIRQQADMLMEELYNTDDPVNEGADLLRLYLQQNVDSLAIISSPDSLDVFNQVFLINRNEAMSLEIQKRVGNAPHFIAVGAAHLSGRWGIIPKLRKLGYSVRAVHN